MSSIRLAVRFLFPVDNKKLTDASAWSSAGKWFVLWGLLIGVFYALVFRTAWRWFGEYEHLRLVPAVCLLIVDAGLCGYVFFAGLADVFRGKGDNNAGQSSELLTLPLLIAVLLICLAKLAIYLSFPVGARMPPADWRMSLSFLYPEVIYRPMILMPLWGRWSMMLATVIGRPAPGASARLGRLAGGSRLTVTLLLWAACAGLTILFVSGTPHHAARALVIGLAVLLGAYLCSFLLARKSGGQTEAIVRATGLAGELAFLISYLPIARSIFWY